MKKLLNIVKVKWEINPLPIVIYVAIFTRLLSVIFSKGWGMLDDHFLVIEVAQSWADGWDVNHWLPWTKGNTGPEGHSFLYVGLHFLLFKFFNLIGLNDPQFKMYIVRFIHAAWSILVVYYSYKISLKLFNKKTAAAASLLIATLWFMPWLSVRNLVEIVAIPLLLIPTWMILNVETKEKQWLWIISAGFIAGLAFSIRYQTGIYIAGIGLALLLQREFKNMLLFGVGSIFSMVLVQGGIDWFIWGRPFAEMGEYIQFNIDNKYNFIQGDWYSYLLLLGGILIPPVSIFILMGMFINIREKLILFLPTILFLLFHIYFPNKQERFILTIVPMVIVLGISGWMYFINTSAWWRRNVKLYTSVWVFFWIVNICALFPISTMYSKRSRVEAMQALRPYENVTEIILENSDHYSVDLLPQFYSGKNITSVKVSKDKPLALDTNKHGIVEENAQFVLFYGNINLEKRRKEVAKYYPNLAFEKAVEPGFVDKVMYLLNPGKNSNQKIYIYRNKKFFPAPIQ